MSERLKKMHRAGDERNSLAVRLQDAASAIVLTAALSVAFQGVAPTPVQAGNECLLDTSDNGTATTGVDSVAGADDSGATDSLACGVDASIVAGATNAVVIGHDASFATATDAAVAIGNDADVGEFVAANNGRQSVAVGNDADVGALALATEAVAIGAGADVGGRAGQNAVGGTAVGAFSDVNEFRGTAIGIGARVDDGAVRATAVGDSAVATGAGAVAVGGSVDGDAVGATAGTNATAVGADSSAAFTNSAAFGNGATATRANQQVFGTATNTYTMVGITSAASQAAQSGPLQLVTSDAAGNLATDGGVFFGMLENNQNRLDALDVRVDGVDRRIDGIDRRVDDNEEGVAIALALENPDLKGNEVFGLMANWGSFEGENAFGLSAMGVIGNDIFGQGTGRLSIAGGVGWGLDQNTLGGRAGVQLTW